MSIRTRLISRWTMAATAAVCCVLSASSQPLEPAATTETLGGDDPAECAAGVVLDDGSAETGYGWVPTVVEGEYVQAFDTADFSSRRLQSVCICWMRTDDDSTIDFEVIFYAQVADPKDDTRLIPDDQPYAVFPAGADVVPVGITESFFEVDVEGTMIPDGEFYIGARWNASADQFFFVCADHSDNTPPVEVFFRDDRSDGEWTSVFETTDPIFDDHKAIMVRALPGPLLAVDVPALGTVGLALLAAALAALAMARSIRRR